MKKLAFFLFFIPSLVFANPYMGSCKGQYNDAYMVMSLRQSNIPMYALVESIENQKPEDYDILTNSELTAFYEAQKESIKIIENAYRMPYVGFMETAAHTMAAEFANQYYARCVRKQRK